MCSLSSKCVVECPKYLIKIRYDLVRYKVVQFYQFTTPPHTHHDPTLTPDLVQITPTLSSSH